MHKAVCCHAVKILQFYADTFPKAELINMIRQKDFQGLDVLEYAKLTENREIIEIIDSMNKGEGIDHIGFGSKKLDRGN